MIISLQKYKTGKIPQGGERKPKHTHQNPETSQKSIINEQLLQHRYLSTRKPNELLICEGH